MSELVWFKSSYSDAGGNNCVEVAAADDGVAIRDSVFPRQTFKVDRRAFATLIAHVSGEE